jgi:hypothetical protein
MRYINKLNIIIVFIFFSGIQLSSQTISLYTFNNGGGFNNTSEWSIGESVSIANFTSNGYILTTGVLQPLTGLSTGINEYGPLVFGHQITIGPNPTSNLLRIKTVFNEPGNLSFQILDSKSALVINQDAGIIFSTYNKELMLNDLPSGVFYVRVYFKPMSGKIKIGVYKIIKI